MKIRTTQFLGEQWASVDDLRAAMNDDGLILKAAAMLKVAHVEHHDSAVEAVRRCIGYFFTEATGLLRPSQPKPLTAAEQEYYADPDGDIEGADYP